MRLFLLFIFFSNALLAANLPYVNWENHPIHALALSPDKTRLAVAHTADNRVQLFDVSLGYPIKLGHVMVGIDPVSVRFADNNELWVVNHISDSVSIIDFNLRKVKATLLTHDEPFDVVFANDKAFVSCSQANQIMVFNVLDLSAEAVVIDVFAEDPRAMAVNNDGSKVYIASFESGNKSTIMAGGIDETEGTLGFPFNPVNRENTPYAGANPPFNAANGFSPSFNPQLPTPPKVSLIVKQNDAGLWLDDNGQDWSDMVSGENANMSGRIVGWKLLDHDITVIDTQTLSLQYVSGLMNSGMALAFNPVQNQISMVGTDATNEIRFEPNLNGTFIRVKLALIAANALQTPQIMDLNPHLDYQSIRVEQSLRDKSIGDPRGIVWSEDGNTAYIAGMGSNNIILINAAGQRLAEVNVGEGATGLALDESRQRLYVWNHFEASLSVVDTNLQSEIMKLPLFNPLPEAIKKGRKFLYDTHLTSGLGQAACASCHIDARMDKLAWDLGDPSGEMKEFQQNCQTQLPSLTQFSCDNYHPMKGPMMTQTLQDIIGNEPFHWRGDRAGIEEFNGAFESINGDDEQLTTQQMQQFKDFLATITFPPNPFRNSDNSLPESIELKNHYTSGRFAAAGLPLGTGHPRNGLHLFNTAVLDNVFQCGSCHTLPTGMAVNGPLKLGALDIEVAGEIMPLGPHDANHLGVVSVDGSTQKSIKTPQLRNLYEKVGFEMSRSESLLGFGFLHDGAIDSVARFLSAPAFSVDSDQEVADLVALMMAFSGSQLDNGNIPLGNTPPESQDTHAGVGQQYTLEQATQTNARIENLVQVASTNDVDLIVKTGDGHSYLFNTEQDIFVAELADEVTILSLMAQANTENSLTFTLVPKGLGTRLAFDRDGDGIRDVIEIQNGSNPANASDTTLRPKTGLWYNPDRNGHGIDVQIAGANLFVIWYTYREDKTPVWYLASSTYQDNWQADLLEFTWDFTSNTTTSQNIGSVQFDFTDASHAQFSWQIGENSGSEAMQRLSISNQFGSKQLTGTYYNPQNSGWGLSVHEEGSSQVAVIYYYDELGQARWSLGSGNNTANSTFSMLSFKGFCPHCAYEEPSNQVIGQVSMAFEPNHEIKFSTQLLYPENSQENWQISTVNLQAINDPFFDAEVE